MASRYIIVSDIGCLANMGHIAHTFTHTYTHKPKCTLNKNMHLYFLNIYTNTQNKQISYFLDQILKISRKMLIDTKVY